MIFCEDVNAPGPYKMQELQEDPNATAMGGHGGVGKYLQKRFAGDESYRKKKIEFLTIQSNLNPYRLSMIIY